MISSSVTVTISSTKRFAASSVIAPTNGGVIPSVIVENHLGPVAPHRVELGAGSVPGHDHDAGGGYLARRPRRRLRVVPGGDRDDALPALGGGQAQDLVQGSPGLEGARLLEAFALELEPDPGALADRGCGEERGTVDAPPDP